MVNDPVADMLTRIRNGDGEARLCADSVVPGQAVHRQILKNEVSSRTTRSSRANREDDQGLPQVHRKRYRPLMA